MSWSRPQDSSVDSIIIDASLRESSWKESVRGLPHLVARQRARQEARVRAAELVVQHGRGLERH
jgi:hypothetical protein